MSSIFLLRRLQSTGIWFSGSRWLLYSHLTRPMNLQGSVECPRPFPMRHPAVCPGVRQRLCDILHPRVQQRLCDILCLRVRQRLCDILCLRVRQRLCGILCLRVRQRLCNVLHPRVQQRLCDILELQVAWSPSRRQRRRVRAAEFGGACELSSAGAVHGQAVIIKVDTLMCMAVVISARPDFYHESRFLDQ